MSNARKLSNLIVGTELKVSGVDSDLTNIVSTLKTRFDSDDTRLQSILSTFESKVSTIKSRLDSDDSKLQALNTALEAGIVNLVDSDLIISQIQAKINSIVSNIDSDSTALQTANTQITTIKSRLDSDSSKLQSLDTTIVNIKSRLDSDSTAIQAVATIADTASRAGGLGDSDLKVVSDLRNQLDSEILFVRNITLSYTDYVFTATAGQTDFTGSDDNSLTLSYTANQILVFLNGIKLEADDFTATDGAKVTLTDPAGVNNEIIIVCPKFESNLPPVTYSWTGVTRGTKYVGSDITSDDDLGIDVDVDSAGTTVIGGAYKHDDKGAVYVYTNDTQVAKLLASNKAHNDSFGKALTISGDGNSIIVASPGRSNGGMCYLFTLSGSTWSEVQTLVSSDLASSDQFGTEINVSKDSNYIIISSPRKAVTVGASTHSLAGAVYIFYKSGSGSSTYSQQAKLSHSNARANELFGTKTAINSDGTVAVIANADHPQGLNGLTVFTRSGTTWTQAQTISLPANQTTFGKGLDISDDGERIVVTSAATTSSGTATIFIYDKSGSTWSLQSSFVMSSTSADNTTSAAGISGDGKQIAVSDLGYKYFHTGGAGNFPNVGAIKIFEYDGSSWSLKTTLVGSAMGENLGESLAFSKGTIPTVVGGAPQHDVLTGGAFVDNIRGDPGSTLVTRDIGAVYRFVAS